MEEELEKWKRERLKKLGGRTNRTRAELEEESRKAAEETKKAFDKMKTIEGNKC